MSVNADVKMDGDVARSCKTSPGSGAGVPLDLSKIRPEAGRQGDAPLDLSVKTRKRSVDDGSPAGHPIVKKPRQDLPSPKGAPDMYYQYRGERAVRQSTKDLNTILPHQVRFRSVPAQPASSPTVGPGSSNSVSSNRPASPAPPPPPPSSGSKMWSRKRMILNAVNQDESLKKSLGVSSVVPPAPPAAGEGEPQQDKGGSVVIRRCSVSGADFDRAAADIPSQQQPPPGHANVPFTCADIRPDGINRPDVIRRSSLDRPWGHQKNIPVANVAPFVHSKSGLDLAGREISDGLQPPAEPPANASSQPKSDDSKTEQTDETKPVSPDVPSTKSPSHTPRPTKQSQGTEQKKITQRSKAVKKSTSLLKKLHRMGKSKPKAYELEDRYKVLKSSGLSVDEQLDSLTADTEILEKSLSSKSAKQKRTKLKKKSRMSSSERAKTTTKDSGQDVVEGEEKGTAETQDRAQQEEKAKKDLALLREERAKRARELKRTALGRRPRREAAKRKGGQYNRNAAYEEEVRRDESRKAIRRARRHASNLARERLQQQQHHADGDEPGNEDDDDDDEEEENSQDSQHVRGRSDENWSTSGTHAQSVRPSRKSRSHRGMLGSGVFAGQAGPAATSSGSGGSGRGGVVGVRAGEEWEQDHDDEYCDDADDESKDLSEDDDGEDTEVGEGNSTSSRGKSRSLVVRKKRRGKLRPVRRKLLEPSFGDDTFEAASSEDVVLEGEESQDASSQSAIPVPPEVKRIAVNKNSGETLLHRAARLGNEVRVDVKT
nr:hypothetical protein BaRGS_014098 [Batillaria attramentaria]